MENPRILTRSRREVQVCSVELALIISLGAWGRFVTCQYVGNGSLRQVTNLPHVASAARISRGHDQGRRVRLGRRHVVNRKHGMGTSGPDDSLYSNMVVTIDVDDSKKYLANYERIVQKMGEIGKKAKAPFFSFDVEQTEIKGTNGLKMSMDLSGMLGDQQDPNAKKAIEAMLGTSDKLDVYFAPADSRTVVVAYVSKQRLVDALEVAKNPDRQLSGDPAIVKATAALPSGAQWIGFWSPRGTVEFVTDMIGKFAPEAQNKIPEFPQTSPVAFAKRLSEEAVDFEMLVPADLVKAIPEFVARVKAKQQSP